MTGSPQKSKSERRLIDWLIAIVGVALAVLLFFFVQQYRTLRRESLINAREAFLAATFRDHAPVTSSDASNIRTWMTFDYVNKLFSLPLNYLKSTLSISSTAYPKLTIGAFAKQTHANASSTLVNIQSAVRQYLMNAAQTSTAPNTSST